MITLKEDFNFERSQKKFLTVYYEAIIMAKRRNLKKEKAQRNLQYARQFRQKTSRSRFSGKKNYNNNNNNTNKEMTDKGQE